MNLQKKVSAIAFGGLACLILSVISVAQESTNPTNQVRIKMELGHTAIHHFNQTIRILGASPGLKVTSLHGNYQEDNAHSGIETQVSAGAGEVDEIMFDIHWPDPSVAPRQLPQHTSMWKYLLENGSPGQQERLKNDPWKQPDTPVFSVILNNDSTLGFSVGMEQLLRQKAIWLPRYDIFITTTKKPVIFRDHIASLQGQRTLNRIENEPDASLEQFKNYWTDFGNPTIQDPSWERWQTRWMGTTGHLTVTAAANGAIYKFAVDRLGNVRPDFASPYKFRLDLSWKDSQWQSQKITDGLPIIVTAFEKEQQQIEIEQFAAPFIDVDAAVYGYLPSVFHSKVNFSGESGPVNFQIAFNNENKSRPIEIKHVDENNWMLVDQQTGDILLMVETEKGMYLALDDQKETSHGQWVLLNVSGRLKKGNSCSFTTKLPSPAAASSTMNVLKNLDHDTAKKGVIGYWEEWINRGAQFSVPEEPINNLIRANLWHALILPRHTLNQANEFHMDIPYANTAYGQKNADWPINQAVYVDYMIYGLRGYEQTATDEISSMFRSQQQANGRMGGFANWGVYSPGHLYAIAQNFLLSRNREQFDQLLPQAIKLLDYCLIELAKAKIGTNKSGLIVAPLNDLSESESEWAFTQAYFAGGLELFGQALSIYGHPRAKEVCQVADQLKYDIDKAFSKSSVKSPVIQLANGTWDNFVPTDARTPRRLLDQWYPSSIDTGPLHLPRLGAVDPFGWLTDAMLHDHEDNLFLHNWGAMNEPVYIPQATVYLLRDEPKAAIRSFYSMTACAFSHNQYTPLEHRWGHPVYYSPPSTDGAWFEVLRKMILNEVGFDTLFLGQAMPRNWFSKGEKTIVQQAPSYFGPVSCSFEGVNSKNEINANIELSDRNPPKELRIRFRHPSSDTIRSVRVNGEHWQNINREKEYITIPHPAPGKYAITATY